MELGLEMAIFSIFRGYELSMMDTFDA